MLPIIYEITIYAWGKINVIKAYVSCLISYM